MVKNLWNSEVRIEPTNLCNYSCTMCPRDKHTRSKGIMSMSLYESILDQIVELGAKKLVLTNFGEPFIDPNLELKIKLANQCGLNTYIITNASLFDKPSNYNPNKTKIQCAIENGLNELRLSFYGNNPKKYSNIMRGGDFYKVIENLKLLKKHKGECEISHYVLQFNEEEEDYLKFPKEIRDVIDYYEIWKPHNFGDGREYRDIQKSSKKSCNRPQGGPLQINWSGIVVPCCYDYNENIILGDASKQPIIDILNSKKYNKLKEAHEKNDYSGFKYCNNCDQLLCNKSKNSIVYSSNPKHSDLSKSQIIKRTNTDPDIIL